MSSIGGKLDQRHGVGPGFDFLRIALAVSVVIWHSWPVSKGDNSLDEHAYIWIFGYSILFLFFCLSGFLIAASALRLRLRDFLINRSLRILPALFVEVLLTAFVLGPLFTLLDLRSYFTDPMTYHYFTNLIGWMNYRLPGVFETNPVNLINISLWTVPFEIGCYGIMTAVILLGLMNRPLVLTLGLLSFIAAGLYFDFISAPTHGLLHEIARLFIGRGSRLFVAFVMGILCYIYRHRIRYSFTLVVGSSLFCVVIDLVLKIDVGYPALSLILGVPLAYLTVAIGVSEIPMPSLLHKNDLSYGIYLYGCPIQQTMIHLYPTLTDPVTQLVISSIPIFGFALFSWNAIERPIIGLRKKFSFIARTRLETATEVSSTSPVVAR